MKTRLQYGAAALFVAAVIAVACSVGSAKPISYSQAFENEDIEVHWWYFPSIERTCMVMIKKSTQEFRRICPEDGGCWIDEGWKKNVLPGSGGNPLPSYFDPNGNLYIVVQAGQGGTFSGSAIGTCLPFTSNTTNVIMMPSHLVY